MTRQTFSFGTLFCLIFAWVHFGSVSLYGSNPECEEDPTACGCPEANPCECTGESGGGSIRFTESITGYVSGDRYRAAKLNFSHKEPSITMHTVQGLNYLTPAAAFLNGISGDFTADEPVQITMATGDLTGGLIFEVADGQSVGYPVRTIFKNRYHINLLDVDKQPVVDAVPRYIERVDSDDMRLLFDYTSGDVVEMIDTTGQSYHFSDVDVLRSSGVLRQIRTSYELVDLVTIDPDHEFEIRLYAPGQYGEKDSATGLYTLNAGATAYKVINIKNPAYDSRDMDETYITRTWGGRVKQWQFKYFENNHYWEVRLGEVTANGFELLEQQEVAEVQQSDQPIRHDYKIIKDTAGNILSHEVTRYQEFPHAVGLLPIAKIQDPEKANLMQRMQYYTEGTKAGEIFLKTEPDGAWTAYDYDAQDREILRLQPWQDSEFDTNAELTAQAVSHEAIYSHYQAVDPRDNLSLKADQPRRETTRIAGQIAGITWYAYFYDTSGLYYERSERAVRPSARYGDADNLWAEKVYFSTASGRESPLRAGRLKQYRQEDGTRLLYDYTRDAAGRFLVTETRLHSAAPAGIAYQSTRVIKEYDSRALLSAEYFQIYDSKEYQAVYHTTHRYDSDRNRIETKRWDGTAKGRILHTASYALDKPIVRTDSNGRTVETAYDILDRKQFEMVHGSSASGVGDILRFYQYTSSATGCGCSASETLIQSSNSSLSLTEINETDRVGRASRRVDVNGLETRYVYADGGRMTTEHLPNGSTRITTRYLDGRVKSVAGTGIVDQYYTYGMNTDGSMWTRVDTADAGLAATEDISSVSDLRYRKNTHDMLDRIVREEEPAFGGGIRTREYSYDAYGRLKRRSETGHADTLYVYGASGDLVRTGLDIDDNGQLVSASVDRITDTGRIYSQENSGWFELTTTKVYPITNDATAVTVSTSKRRLSGFSGALASETTSEDINGNKTVRSVEIDRANKTVTRRSTRPGSVVDALSVSINGYLKEENSTTVAAATTYSYDGLGRRIAVKDPRHSRSATIDYYTGTRQVFTRTNAAGHATTFAYYGNGEPGAGQIKSVTNALSQSTYYSYDLSGHRIRIWGETDYPQEYGYNAFGELATLTTWRDAADAIDFSTATWPAPAAGTGDTTTWTYAPATGLLTRKEYADGSGTDYSYDAANRLAVRSWARDGGLDTTYSYDANTGELLNVNYEAADTTDNSYTYDRLGRRSTVTDATGTRSFDYDASTLRLDQETLPSAFYGDVILERAYEDGSETNGLTGRPAGYLLGTSVDPDAYRTVDYTYAANGRFQSVSDGTDTFTYVYKTNSNLLASLTAPHHTVDYSYEANRDVMTRVDNQVSGSTISKYGYSYDALGRRDDRAQSGSEIHTASIDDFSYNTRSEVTGSTNSAETSVVWNPTYSFDKIGNRESSTGAFAASYTANELNQYTAIDSTNPVHDADGNLTSDGSWTYTWNNENRLASATDGTTTIDFTYDYQGRLVKKADGSTVEVYVYDGWNRIATFLQTSTLTLQTSYLWGLDLSGSMQGAGGVGGLLKEGDLYVTYDANGNIMQKLDSTGADQMNVAYDPFGNIISGTLVGEYGFSTKPLVADIDWYYYGFRYYDPVTGRWPNRDPIGEKGGLNIYGMANNNPTNYTDILGLRFTLPRIHPDIGRFVDNHCPNSLADFCVPDQGPGYWNETLTWTNSSLSSSGPSQDCSDCDDTWNEVIEEITSTERGTSFSSGGSNWVYEYADTERIEYTCRAGTLSTYTLSGGRTNVHYKTFEREWFSGYQS